MKISTLLAMAFLSGLIPAAWACDYGKPTDASVGAPVQTASIGTPATSQAAAPSAASKATTPNAAKLTCVAGNCDVKKHTKPAVVACDGGSCQ